MPKIWLVGGASLIKQFLSKAIIDEFIITTVPLLLGRGIPLFKEHLKEQMIQLVEFSTFEGNIIQTYYKVNK
ncbi:MAG: dihydrofolate reductase family protein [Promethearchaeota archaeon]